MKTFRRGKCVCLSPKERVEIPSAKAAWTSLERECLDARASFFIGAITSNRKQRPLYRRITNHMKRRSTKLSVIYDNRAIIRI